MVRVADTELVDEMVRLIFIRHGETDGNKTHRFQHPETPLSPNGEKQARLLAKRIKEAFNVKIILASPYQRAQATAKAILDAIKSPDQEVGDSPTAGLSPDISLLNHVLLKERNFGDFRGKSYMHVIENKIRIFSPVVDMKVENGESVSEFNERCRETHEMVLLHARIADRYEKGVQIDEESKSVTSEAYDVCIVSHGLTLKNLFQILLNDSDVGQPKSGQVPETIRRVSLFNTSVTVVEVDFDPTSTQGIVSVTKEVQGRSRPPTAPSLSNPAPDHSLINSPAPKQGVSTLRRKASYKDYQVAFTNVFNCTQHLETEEAKAAQVEFIKPRGHL